MNKTIFKIMMSGGVLLVFILTWIMTSKIVFLIFAIISLIYFLFIITKDIFLRLHEYHKDVQEWKEEQKIRNRSP